MEEPEIRENIKKYITEFFRNKKDVFVPGKTKIWYGGSAYNEEEAMAMIDVILKGWWGLGKYGLEFEKGLAGFLGIGNCLLANSGSSANLLAVSALMSGELENHLNPGDEIITPALTFPTTFNPILQNSLVPVVVDIELGNYNMNVSDLEKAIGKKTRAIMIPHTLGNPNDMKHIMEIAEKHNLFVIEDACDALGSKLGGKNMGSFGDMGTFSFYPAHQMTTGEGGAVVTGSKELNKIIMSLRDWGRACFCRSDETNPDGACGNRFNFKIDGMPYDHKFIYSHIGYNLKPTEVQAAMGVNQMKKLPDFIKKRKENFDMLYNALSEYEDFFVLPKSIDKAEPCWFVFPLTIKNSSIARKEIINFLQSNGIECRYMLSGNILRHPAYRNIKCRVFGKLDNTDIVMRNGFYVGCHHSISREKTEFMAETFRKFMKMVKDG